MVNTIRAELSKILALPGTWVATAIAVLIPLGIAVLNLPSYRDNPSTGRVGAPTVDGGFQESTMGLIGVIVLGVIIISSEYTVNGNEVGGGRQITTSLTAVPGRGRLLAAKTLVLAGLVAVLAAIAVPATVLATRTLIGESAAPLGADTGWRMLGAVLYWVLTALMAFGITVLTRSGILPLIVLIANTSVVSVSFLLTKATPLARFLPDVAGVQMYVREYHATDLLAPVPGGLVMAAWTAGVLAVAWFRFTRRDA
ncbi:MAG TPA: ABC transporter permease [Nonomuraea sp.]|nr:ABC transporter permease [Nonomuraea sp.]